MDWWARKFKREFGATLAKSPRLIQSRWARFEAKPERQEPESPEVVPETLADGRTIWVCVSEEKPENDELDRHYFLADWSNQGDWRHTPSDPDVESLVRLRDDLPADLVDPQGRGSGNTTDLPATTLFARGPFKARVNGITSRYTHEMAAFFGEDKETVGWFDVLIDESAYCEGKFARFIVMLSQDGRIFENCSSEDFRSGNRIRMIGGWDPAPVDPFEIDTLLSGNAGGEWIDRARREFWKKALGMIDCLTPIGC